MSGPSSHLSWAEMACKDGTPYPERWRVSRAAALAAEFEKVRRAVGDRPIVIGSAYRTPSHNRAVGGAANSQHVEGRALDLYPPKGMSVDTFYEICHSIAIRDDSAVCGIGRYPTFVHIDTRPSARLVVWRGSRAWAEVKTQTKGRE